MDRRSLLTVGDWFEKHIANQLQQTFPGSTVLQDLRLFSHYLSTIKQRPVDTQIDLVLITDFKIYVIEAKKWNLEITGDRDDHMWYGKSNIRSNIHHINPVEQNMVHVRALRNLLRRNNYDVPSFANYVCVPNGTHIISNCREVMELSQLIFKVKCDQLDFIEKESTSPLDIKYWDMAISDVIRKGLKTISK